MLGWIYFVGFIVCFIIGVLTMVFFDKEETAMNEVGILLSLCIIWPISVFAMAFFNVLKGVTFYVNWLKRK